MYPLVVPRELSDVTSEYLESEVFYTDNSLIEGSAGFAIHRNGVGGFRLKLSSLAGVFSSELSALLISLRHIREVIQPPEKYLIRTDSLRLCFPEEFRGKLIRSYMQLCFDLIGI
jgi:hypothetical protein